MASFESSSLHCDQEDQFHTLEAETEKIIAKTEACISDKAKNTGATKNTISKVDTELYWAIYW